MANLRPTLSSLSGLRFFSALLVVAYHYAYFPEAPLWVNRFLSYGSKGVTFFFLLSGFILSYRYDGENPLLEMRKFYGARIARIIPTYWLSILLSLPLLYKMLWKDGVIEFFGHGVDSIFMVVLFMLGGQSWIPIEPIAYGMNTPAWSISVEMFFYLLFPFIFYRLSLSWKKYPIILASYLGIHALIIYVLPKEILGHKTTWANFPLSCLPLFLMGIALFEIYKKIMSIEIPLKWTKLISHLWVFLTFFYYLTSIPEKYYFLDLFVTTILFSGIILIYACGTGPCAKLLSTSLAVGLGEASYALYILQAPLKLYLQQIYSKLFKFENTLSSEFSLYLLVGLTLLSVLVYKKYEVKCREILRTKI